jgi:hypothetical protein
MKFQTFKTIFVATALLLGTACSTSHVATTNSQVDPDVRSAQVTSVEINYFLGHNEHRFAAESTTGKAQITTFLERSIVEQATVDPSKYSAFLAKVVTFAEKPKRAPSEEAECHSPFSIIVKIDAKTYTSKGCRSGDNEGGLSRLIRDGEFLLYSKK